MKVFFDTEFTSLSKDADLISIGIVTEDGREFYAEVDSYKEPNPWVKEHVIPRLLFSGHPKFFTTDINKQGKRVARAKLSPIDLKGYIEKFFSEEKIEFWSDCVAWDWVLFCDLWGGADYIPDNFHYIPFDICTLFHMGEIDPDINRESFLDIKDLREKHNALHDARVIKACYEKLIKNVVFKGLTVYDQL